MPDFLQLQKQSQKQILTLPSNPYTAPPGMPSPDTILQSQASEAEIMHAWEAGRDWATDSTTPTTFYITTLPEPDNHWLPNSYDEAMMWPDLWEEPIEKEMKNMRDRNVWKVIENPPPDICTIKTHWTFANKMGS